MRTSSVFTTRASASTRCGGGGDGKASRRHAHRSINRTRRAAAASVCRASGRDVDAPRSTHTMVVYWDLDNIRPPSGCEVRRRRRRRRRRRAIESFLCFDSSQTLFARLTSSTSDIQRGPRVKRPGYKNVNHRSSSNPSNTPWVDEFMRLRHLFVCFIRRVALCLRFFSF